MARDDLDERGAATFVILMIFVFTVVVFVGVTSFAAYMLMAQMG